LARFLVADMQETRRRIPLFRDFSGSFENEDNEEYKDELLRGVLACWS
jgi:hypothetical protein